MGGLLNTLSPIPTKASQVGDHSLSTSCGIVERPDQHCGDGLVTLIVAARFKKIANVITFVTRPYCIKFIQTTVSGPRIGWKYPTIPTPQNPKLYFL